MDDTVKPKDPLLKPDDFQSPFGKRLVQYCEAEIEAGRDALESIQDQVLAAEQRGEIRAIRQLLAHSATPTALILDPADE